MDDRKTREKNINSSQKLEEQSRKILEAAPDSILIIDSEGKITLVNSQTEKLFSYPRTELLDQQIEILIPESYRSRHSAHRHDYFKSPRIRPMGLGLELYGQRKNGETFPVEISLSPLATEDGIFTLAAIRDVTDRKNAEAKLEELNQKILLSARQAGMAEFANSVLHNVGNILNSAKVSIGLIRNHAIQLNITRELNLVATELNDLSLRLQEKTIDDHKIKLLPEYMTQLTKKFDNENQKVSEEIENLAKQIYHAIDIIFKQHSISGTSLTLEKVSIDEILNPAIKITGIPNLEIEVNETVDNIPLLVTDKNKLLQILVNLITNAKEALLLSNKPTKKCLNFFVKKTHTDMISIVIEDNGIGISPDNIGRVFSFGFTTKKDSLGFGLHNSWLLAKDLGGSLEVHSDGIGTGARFTLTLPMAR